MSNKKKVMTSGNLAFAEAMRQINPDVVAASPITPSTEIPMRFADFVANGKVDSEYVAVESEHSAISACVGASISGARVMTASSANGVALMHEIFPIAASFRAPIVFGLVNRSLGAPVNIHCDHSDSMPERDSGWVQIYCEDAQEVYDSVLLAVRLAEDPRVLTPVFVCQDGFTATSRSSCSTTRRCAASSASAKRPIRCSTSTTPYPTARSRWPNIILR